jgi:hypothetical protein
MNPEFWAARWHRVRACVLHPTIQKQFSRILNILGLAFAFR